jgi:2-C-methyl-D-erythritol 4-phosphate cytidylyltransferase
MYMKKFAVIVAGGSGLRMGASIPKQFLLLQDKPLLWHTVQAFASAFTDMNIVLVLPQTHLDFGASIAAMFTDITIQIITGGDSRFQSVKNGLSVVPTDAVVFVHDGVRCLITKDLIVKCYNQALEKGSAIPAVAATDSIRIANGNNSVVADRNNVRIIQTPQTFKSDLLLAAFQQPYNDAFTDEATVVEAYGEKIYLIEGDYTNLKITRPIDLLIAEKILEERLAL